MPRGANHLLKVPGLQVQGSVVGGDGDEACAGLRIIESLQADRPPVEALRAVFHHADMITDAVSRGAAGRRGAASGRGAASSAARGRGKQRPYSRITTLYRRLTEGLFGAG